MTEVNVNDYDSRRAVLHEATYQIDKLLEALQSAAHAEDTDGIEFLIRGMTPRLQQLNCVVMRAFDEADSVESMREVLVS